MAYQSLESKLGWILVQNAGLKEKDLQDVLSEQRETQKKLGEILIEKKLLKPEDIAKALAIQLGIPFLNEVKAEDIDARLVQNLTIHYCRENQILPLMDSGERLSVCVSDPFRYQPIEALRLAFKKPVDVVLTTHLRLEDAINRVFERAENVVQEIEEDEEDLEINLAETIDLLESMDEESKVIRFVNSLLFQAVKEKASDIHIEPFEKNVIVRFRIDGILYDRRTASKRLHAAISSRVKVMAELNIAEKRTPQDGRVKVKLAKREIDIRLSVVPTVFGERLVMRLLDKSSVVLDLPALGFSSKIEKQINDLTNRKYGIFLVTGPTGSGKSTTLSAALKGICSPERNIVTVEDPVEYQLPGVAQIAVNPKVGLTFASGLRAILRQDPDVVMVGEIRDKETAEIAINASLTGHLVLSTIHTNDAPGAVTRLVDMGIEPFLVSSSLVGVLAQRLIRLVCQSCAEEYEPTNEILQNAGITREELATVFHEETPVFKKSNGCSECRLTGYRGRSAIHELMVISEELRNSILTGSDAGSIRKLAVKQGMKSLRHSAIEKLLQGKTSLEEIVRMTQLEN